MRQVIVCAVVLLLAMAATLWTVADHGRPRGPVVAIGLPRSIDPVVASRLDELRLIGALFEPLVRLDPLTLTPQPALAESWSVAPDRLTWTFHLRADACWSNGAPVVAADVRRGLLRHLSEGSPYADLLAASLAGGREAMRGGALDAVGIACPDAHTVVLTLRAPSPEPVMILSLPLYVPALESHLASRGDDQHAGGWADPRLLVGNGPLVCVGFQPRHHYDFAPNPHYHGAHPARGPLRVLVVEDPGCAQRLYLDGAVDALLALQPDGLRDLTRAAVPGLRRGPSLTTEFIRIRQKPRPVGDQPAVTAALLNPRLRLALARSVDRVTLGREVMDGLGLPATTFAPAVLADHLPYHPPGGVLAFDPAQARRDLAAARQELGTIPAFEILTPSAPLERLRTVEFVIDGWRRTLGLTIDLLVKPATEVRAMEEAGTFDLSRSTWLGDYLDPTTFLDVWRGNSGVNRTGFRDPAYDALLDRAAQTIGDERWRLLEQAESHLLDQVPCIPLVHTTCNMLVRPGLLGIAPNALELVWLGEVGWDRK